MRVKPRKKRRSYTADAVSYTRDRHPPKRKLAKAAAQTPTVKPTVFAKALQSIGAAFLRIFK